MMNVNDGVYAYSPYGENGNAEQGEELFSKILKAMTSPTDGTTLSSSSCETKNHLNRHPVALLIDNEYEYFTDIGGADNLLTMLAACKRYVKDSSDGELYTPEWMRNDWDYSGRLILDHVQCPGKPGEPSIHLLQRLILLSLDPEEIADADSTRLRMLDRDFNLGKLVKTFFDNRAKVEEEDDDDRHKNMCNEYKVLYDFVTIANNSNNNNGKKNRNTRKSNTRSSISNSNNNNNNNNNITDLCCCYFYDLRCLEVHKTKFMKCALFLARFDELRSMVNVKKVKVAFQSPTLENTIRQCLETMNSILETHVALRLVQMDPARSMDELLAGCRIGKFSTSTGAMTECYDSQIDAVISIFKSKDNITQGGGGGGGRGNTQKSRGTNLSTIETRLKSVLRGEAQVYLGYSFFYIDTPEDILKNNNININNNNNIEWKRTGEDAKRLESQRAAKKQKAASEAIVVVDKMTGKTTRYESVDELADELSREILSEKARNEFFVSHGTVGTFVSDCEEATEATTGSNSSKEEAASPVE